MHITVDTKSSKKESTTRVLAILIVSDVKCWAVAAYYRDHWCGYIGVNRAMWNTAENELDEFEVNLMNITFAGIAHSGVHAISAELLTRFEIEEPEMWVGVDWSRDALIDESAVFQRMESIFRKYLEGVERAYEKMLGDV